jgi:ABC-type nitrate/sulfonate/bicarbonate transport system permease component
MNVKHSARGLSGWATPRLFWGSGSVFVFLVIWQVLGATNIVKPQYISQPTRVIRAGYELLSSGGFMRHVYTSMSELLIGFLLALVFGVLSGLLMGRYRILGGLFDPLIMALYATPRVALIPLFVVWFGVGMGSKVFVVFIGVIFPILINTMTGIRQVDRTLLQAGRSYGATERQLFTKILLPGALPAMMTGIRLGWGRGILGMVIGEMYVSMAGLGHLMMTAGNAMKTDMLFFLIIIVAGLGYLGSTFFRLLERKLVPWRKEE